MPLDNAAGNVSGGEQGEQKATHGVAENHGLTENQGPFSAEETHIHYDVAEEELPEVKSLAQIIKEMRADAATETARSSKDGALDNDDDVVLEEMGREWQREYERQQEAFQLKHEKQALSLEREFLTTLVSTHAQERELSMKERDALMQACKSVVRDAVAATKMNVLAQTSAQIEKVKAQGRADVAAVKVRAEVEKMDALKAHWDAAQSAMEAKLPVKQQQQQQQRAVHEQLAIARLQLQADHAREIQKLRTKIETELRLESAASFEAFRVRQGEAQEKMEARLEDKLEKERLDKLRQGSHALRVEKLLRERVEKAEARCIVLQSSLAGAIKELDAERESYRKQRTAHQAELKTLREAYQVVRNGDKTLLDAQRVTDAKREAELKRETELRAELERSLEKANAVGALYGAREEECSDRQVRAHFSCAGRIAATGVRNCRPRVPLALLCPPLCSALLCSALLSSALLSSALDDCSS